MFRTFAVWCDERKKSGCKILVGKTRSELEELQAEAVEWEERAQKLIALANDLKLSATHLQVKSLKSLIKHGEDGTCTCGKCKDLVPQRKQELEQLQQMLRPTTLEVGASSIGSVEWSSWLGKVKKLSQVHTEFLPDADLWLRRNSMDLPVCRMELAKSGFPIVLYPKLWLLLELCVSQESRRVLAEGLRILLKQYLQRAKTKSQRWCDVEFSCRAVTLVLGCAWGDAKETIQATASRCWWMLVVAERIVKLANDVCDLFKNFGHHK